MQNPPQDPKPRQRKRPDTWQANFRTRRLALIIAYVVTLLAVSSTQAVIVINADEVGGNVVFTLSGSLNTDSLDSITEVDDSFSFHQDRILPLQLSGVPPGNFTQISFGTALPLTTINRAHLANLKGPAGYGQDFGFGTFHPSTNLGSIFGFEKFTPNSGLGSLHFPASYSSLSELTASMSFEGTFTSLNLAPGTYEWDWSNSSTQVQDSLILQIGVPEPSATMLMITGLAALCWLCRKIVS